MKLTMPPLAALAAGAVLGLLPLAAQAGTYTVVHNFAGGKDGASPVDGLLLARNGDYIGTTPAGGPANVGTVYQIHPNGVETVLYAFTGQNNDGAQPNGGVIQVGSLYFGTTEWGGKNGVGTVFKLQGRTETVLYSFGTSSEDGGAPVAGLIADSHGNLYGTTSQGGVYGHGNVFELVKPKLGGTGWTETILYIFGAESQDGSAPIGRLAFDAEGNLYGTTSYGGAYANGTVFELKRGAKWKETILHAFQGQSGSDGGVPYGGLVADTAGNFYGAATEGGLSGGGTVFELSPGTHGWAFSVLGSVPGWSISGTFREVLLAPNGTIYAATHCDGNGAGSLYQLTKSGSSWTYTLLYDINGGSDGAYSVSNLLLKGNTIYGTTIYGGAHGNGTVYAYTP
jgi:uncharacterized repeat protein (TIGR03803 family)